MDAILNTKKAVSPLVATVLLIAFAVALGAVVMSWSGQVAADISSCQDVSIQIEEIDNTPDICFSPRDQMLFFSVSNGPTAVEGLSISIIGSKSSTSQEESISIPAYAIQKVNTPYDATQFGSVKKVVIQPFFSRSDNNEICSDQRIEVDTIPTCALDE